MELEAFSKWLKERGYADCFGSARLRCKEHGYRESGVLHYPTVEDRHTYYSCIHCLRDSFENAPDSIPPQTPITRKEFIPKRVPVEHVPDMEFHF